MARISFADKRLLDRLFVRSGYVLDFTNNTFAEFFESEVGVNIYDQKYEKGGTSKGNRLRTFLEVEDEPLVAQALRALGAYLKTFAPVAESDADQQQLDILINSLDVGKEAKPTKSVTEGANLGPPAQPVATVTMRGGQEVVSAFASYAHQGEPCDARVLVAVQHLRSDGIDCWIDQFEVFPKEGWILWMQRQIAERHWILVFASGTYKRRADGSEKSGEGLGAIWEHGIVRQELYDAGLKNERFVPVGFGADARKYVPAVLKAFTYFDLDNDGDYRRLLSVLNGVPHVVPNALGSPASAKVVVGGAPSAAELDERYAAELKFDRDFFPILAPAVNGRLELAVRAVDYKPDRFSRNDLARSLEKVRARPANTSQFSDAVPFEANTSASGFGSGVGIQATLQEPLLHKVEHVRMHRSGVYRLERLFEEDFADDGLLTYVDLQLRLEDLIRNVTLLFDVAGRVARIQLLEPDDRLEVVVRVSGLRNRKLVPSKHHPDARTPATLLHATTGSEASSTSRFVLERNELDVEGDALARRFLQDLLWNFGLTGDEHADVIRHVQSELRGGSGMPT